MNDDELLAKVRDLRDAGSSPKQIARALGVPPARVNPLIRALATARRGTEEIAACYVTSGWSAGLTVDGRPDWPALEAPETTESGLVGVLVAQATGHNRLTAAGFLVDVYCLGVKNAWPPKQMTASRLPDYTDKFFSAFSGQPLPAPAELARHLVYGAVDYARSLGFEPHPDFTPAAELLGPWSPPSVITFGKNGAPFYIQGPYDDARHVMQTLQPTIGTRESPPPAIIK